MSYRELAQSAQRVRDSLIAMRREQLLKQSLAGAHAHQGLVQQQHPKSGMHEAETNLHLPPSRVAFLTPPTRVYASTLLGTWAAGLIGVPVSPLSPPRAIASTVADCSADIVVTAAPYGEDAIARIRALSAGSFIHLPILEDDVHSCSSVSDCAEGDASSAGLNIIASQLPSNRPAMLLYTSGTTGTPKGVVWTNEMLDYQVAMLANEWRWSRRDRILNVLPLHHVHGIVNVLLTSLYAGAHCEMMDKFDAGAVWSALLRPPARAPTVFMGVPTVYHRLIEHYEKATGEKRAAMRESAATLRLYVCGSAALSPTTLEAWHRISGHPILERYGMTETGMLLSNPYEERVPSSLGVPLPGVEVKVVPDGVGNHEKCASLHEEEGELLVRGPGVFREYWNRADATAVAFDNEGWFRTGDIVRMDAASQRCTMLGRASTDIIKSGGYKLSAVEIEDHLTDAPSICTAAVFGVEDVVLGQRLACVVVPKQTALSLTAEDVSRWLSTRVPRYKVPRDIHIVSDAAIPRNALGKVQKKLIAQRFASLSRVGS
jgi:malonyl-CoA/methylmalonyl-CoA synthetase